MPNKKINDYLQEIRQISKGGNAKEHSYRGPLENMLNAIISDKSIRVTNEPSRTINVGAPDYSITKNKIPLGYIETKDIGDTDLQGEKTNKEQLDRYKKALSNLIVTDYLRFYFYQNAELKTSITLATIENNQFKANTEKFKPFADTIKNFSAFIGQTIENPSQLAELMAGKARLLENIIKTALSSEEQNEADNSLKNQYKIFRSRLIHDLSESDFADIYAQTIAYGLFAARLHDKNLQIFSREEAQLLIPKTNPFLRGLFNYIGGADCDDRLIWIIDELADIFKYTDVARILYRNKKTQTDPVIHFYETFLNAYNPKLRKSRGVWYTPQAVVNFIVRAVDEVLKTEFNLGDGLINTSKVQIKIDDVRAGYTKNGKQRQKQITTHRLQILDPATGAATFLAEAIKLMKKTTMVSHGVAMSKRI